MVDIVWPPSSDTYFVWLPMATVVYTCFYLKKLIFRLQKPIIVILAIFTKTPIFERSDWNLHQLDVWQECFHQNECVSPDIDKNMFNNLIILGTISCRALDGEVNLNGGQSGTPHLKKKLKLQSRGGWCCLTPWQWYIFCLVANGNSCVYMLLFEKVHFKALRNQLL